MEGLVKPKTVGQWRQTGVGREGSCGISEVNPGSSLVWRSHIEGVSEFWGYADSKNQL